MGRVGLRISIVFSFIFLISSWCQSVQAQDGGNDEKIGFGFRSAGLTIGWYKPSMSYWNDDYFTDTTHLWENKFKGSFVYTGFLELNIINDLRVKLSGSYYTESVNSGEIPVGEVTGTEQLTTSMTSVSLDAIYKPGFLSFEKFAPYAGLGVSLLLVQNKLIQTPYDNPEVTSTQQGQDITGTVIAGIERTFGKHLGMAVDFRYIIGNYTQEMKDLAGNVTTHPVSVAGPQIGLSIYYILR